ncbi:MAG TPA: hypothetical protein VH575_22245 [Gemmataceae bacterium]
MSEDLLLELESAAPITESLDNIEDLLRVVVRELGWAVEGMKGSARAFENTWRRIVLDVARGQTTEIQAARPRLLSAFEKRLNLLKHTRALAIWLSTLGRADLPDPDALVPEIAGLEQMKTKVFDQWQSADDLERLAVEHYPLSQSRLEQIAATHAPPTEWYQGDEERLFQE